MNELRELHPASGYGVVPDPHKEGRWMVRLWDGQTGASRYVAADIHDRKHAEYIRDFMARNNP